MKYRTEMVWNQGHDSESWDDMEFDTLEKAVGWINHQLLGRSNARVWINGKQFRVRDCRVVDSNGDELCINPVWHDIFANEQDRIRPVITNPATYEAKGETL